MTPVITKRNLHAKRKVNMATIISEAEVTAAIEEALAEDFGDMEDANADETPTETKIETMRFSFEPRSKYNKRFGIRILLST